jgi:hypothetical protein
LTRLGKTIVGVLLSVILAGCTSSDANQSSDVKTSRLYWLMRVRNHAVSQGRPPKSQDEFKRYIGGLDAEARDAVMKGAAVSNVDELFVSERDGQPYVIFYGQPPAGVAADLAGYERTGVEGRRYVGYGLGIVDEVDEQRFNELVPPAARPAK